MKLSLVVSCRARAPWRSVLRRVYLEDIQLAERDVSENVEAVYGRGMCIPCLLQIDLQIKSSPIIGSTPPGTRVGTFRFLHVNRVVEMPARYQMVVIGVYAKKVFPGPNVSGYTTSIQS